MNKKRVNIMKKSKHNPNYVYVECGMEYEEWQLWCDKCNHGDKIMSIDVVLYLFGNEWREVIAAF